MHVPHLHLCVNLSVQGTRKEEGQPSQDCAVGAEAGDELGRRGLPFLKEGGFRDEEARAQGTAWKGLLGTGSSGTKALGLALWPGGDDWH